MTKSEFDFKYAILVQEFKYKHGVLPQSARIDMDTYNNLFPHCHNDTSITLIHNNVKMGMFYQYSPQPYIKLYTQSLTNTSSY